MCLALYFSTVQPAQQRRDAARLNAQALQLRIAQAGPGSNARARPMDEQLAAFYGNFPKEHEAPDAVGKIAAIAQRDGLILQQAEYKAERDTTGKLTRFQVSLPLKGEYQTLRRFLSDLHAEIPIASLEQVQFERRKVGDSQVDAKVRLVIYLGKAS
ncbi:MAG TPA: type 4a pilus biogenesis protein PilO [Ramlibacter sp.]|nr:type 4a pilus biogenesis protein PilO [Ramlibacter sp.]